MGEVTTVVRDPDFTLLCGDVRAVLETLPAESVHCVVTSPPLEPYWGLRDYGVDGQIGLEASPEEYVETMVGVFRGVRRVLRSDGTLWLNLGDSYAGSWGAQGRNGQMADRSIISARQIVAHPKKASRTGSIPDGSGLKPKDLVGIPWRVAFALQQDGWYLRSCIVWAKPNPMPESVTDRPTTAHEYVFLLSKSPRYFYDADAVREPMAEASAERYTYGLGGPKAVALREMDKDGMGVRTRVVGERGANPSGRNLRSVWTIATEPYAEAHFATFPQALVEPCIKAGTSERGVCPECGAPWQRETPRQTTGWRPSCGHGHEPVPATVLDPFGGSGTTALVARRLGRRSILIELNEQYAQLAAQRLQQLSLLSGMAEHTENA